MNKFNAMKIFKNLISKQRYNFSQIQYINTNSEIVDIRNLNTIHMTYFMGSNIKQIQTTVTFEEKYLDSLSFVSPRILRKEYVNESIRFINFVNGYIKSGNGRFYIDEEYLDIAYAIRIQYYIFEQFENECTEDMLSVVMDFYNDISVPLWNVATGIWSADEGIECIKDMIDRS